MKPIVLKGEQKKVLFLQVTEPIQIKGVAGSGKTTVALYRAKHLLDTQSNLFQEAKVAIFTYNKTLVKYINAITPHISGGYQQDSEEIKPTKPKGINVFVTSFHKWAYHFIEANGNDLYGRTVMGEAQKSLVAKSKAKFSYNNSNLASKSAEFFVEEISWMKGKAFQSKEEYLEAKRAGRGTNDRVTKADKEIIWSIFTDYNAQLKATNQVDFDDYALLCLKIINSNPNFSKPFTHIIVDEAQDLSKAQILVISQLVSDETKSISIIADAAQRIYKSGFTWSEVGLNVRGGRTIEFKKNYRNTVQIVKVALSLLEKEDDKSDFTTVETVRKGEEKPIVGYFQNWNEQCAYILKELNKLKANDNINSTVILHRSRSGLNNIQSFLENNNFETQILLNTADIDFDSDSIKICTLSSVKGLEFENVFIIDLNDDIIPYPPGFIDTDDEYHISTERRLLYTSMTRARERLYMLSSGTRTRYLDEINLNYVNLIYSISSFKKMLGKDVLPFYEILNSDKEKTGWLRYFDKEKRIQILINRSLATKVNKEPNKIFFNVSFSVKISNTTGKQYLEYRLTDLK
ncbi:3'-5' exonuclease [Bergeyella porcorum]|uniref:3'-5' exonuclease n=1 Tax=Bergeyella porcorum TaxID=1735111 RepID=UPI003671BCE1